MTSAGLNGHDALANAPLVLVSNRGPVTFDVDADGARTEKRGTGGLVTALTGLVNHRSDTLWVASAMTDEDRVVSAEHDHKAFAVNPNPDTEYRVRYITAIARNGGPRIRYQEVVDVKRAERSNTQGNYKFTVEVAARRGQFAYVTIVHGRDPQYLDSFSVKRVDPNEKEID